MINGESAYVVIRCYNLIYNKTRETQKGHKGRKGHKGCEGKETLFIVGFLFCSELSGVRGSSVRGGRLLSEILFPVFEFVGPARML